MTSTLSRLSLTLPLAAALGLSHAQAATIPKPDALLAIDLNRVAVVERIVEQWRGELGGMPVESFRAKLMTLRADGLMSANLSGSFDAVLEQLSAAQRGVDGVGSASALEAARTGVVDAASLERLMQRLSLSNKHTKAIGEVDKDLVYTPIAPCNLMDTRPGVSPVPPEGGPALTPGYAVRTVQVTGRCTVPSGAKGIAALYTIENIPSSGGVVFAGDAGGTGGAVVSWSAPSQYSSGSGITPLSTAGAMQLQSAGGTHIKVDVTGYFMPSTRNGDGLRIVTLIDQIPNIINGDNTNAIVTTSGDMRGATISGGSSNIVGDSTGGFGWYGTIGGGLNNRVGDAAGAGGDYGTVGGGQGNTANRFASTVPGGYSNVAGGDYSFAAGHGAKVRTPAQAGNGTGDHGTFVWADNQGTDFTSTGPNQFNIRANGGVRLNNDTSMFFGNQVRQMINLWSTGWGIGVQSNTLYNRSGGYFAWYQNGSHNDAALNAGGGATLMVLSPSAVANAATGVAYAQSFVNNSDVSVKTAFAKVNPLDVLKKVVAMPITSWAYKSDSAARHIGPMAQDFAKAFGLGAGDKNIATVDADGVALAAIQGLNQKLVSESAALKAESSALKLDSKAKDAKIAALERANESMQRELSAIKKKLGL